MLHKWEFIKERRHQYEQIVAKMKKERNLKKRWAKLLHTQAVIQQIYQVFNQHKTEVRRKQKIHYCARRVAKIFKNWKLRIAPNYGERLVKKVINVFNYSTMMTYDASKDRAHCYLKSFLQETSEIFDMK